MQCERETMCSPCWRSTPNQASVICQSVYDLQPLIRNNVLPLVSTVEVVQTNCGKHTDFEQGLIDSVRERFEEEGVEIYPLARTLTDLEIDE